jgi:hypothetical protein
MNKAKSLAEFQRFEFKQEVTMTRPTNLLRIERHVQESKGFALRKRRSPERSSSTMTFLSL